MADSSNAPKKVLIFRLSSLGDVILASSALEVPVARNWEVHWVVASEFAPVLSGHAGINKIWEYDRRSGREGWSELCEELQAQGFDEVYDLQVSIRTWLAKQRLLKVPQGHKEPPTWHKMDKERLGHYGYYWFKGLWPKQWRPKKRIEQFARTLGGDGTQKPNLGFLIEAGELPESLYEESWFEQPFVCVMPSSKWGGKEWAAQNYVEVIEELKVFPVIMGLEEDRMSQRLITLLTQKKIKFYSGVGRWNLREVANILGRAKAYLGVDTGLGHLAEAVGTPAWVVFGPTVPDMGFGPWRGNSRVVQKSMWCRPCGKDGRFCHRILFRHNCMKALRPKDALKVVSK